MRPLRHLREQRAATAQAKTRPIEEASWSQTPVRRKRGTFSLFRVEARQSYPVNIDPSTRRRRVCR